MAKRDIHQEITDQIIAALEAGTPPWVRGWQGKGAGFDMPMRSNGEPYQGINILLLWMAAEKNGFEGNSWYTYKQAHALGGQVARGSKSSKVVFFSTFEKEQTNGKTAHIPFLKQYSVFNVQQIEGLPEKLVYKPQPEIDTGERHIDQLKQFFESTGAYILEDGTSPMYRPGLDQIHMPFIHQYDHANEYYGTLAHELVHWTGHKSRLDRLPNFPKTHEVALEELIAELGSVFLSTQIGATREIDNSAAYCASWLKALRNDKKFIFKAASAASKAVRYISDTTAHNSEEIAA